MTLKLPLPLNIEFKRYKTLDAVTQTFPQITKVGDVLKDESSCDILFYRLEQIADGLTERGGQAYSYIFALSLIEHDVDGLRQAALEKEASTAFLSWYENNKVNTI